MLTIKELKTPLIGPVDLNLDKASCLAVSGPSGAGKSLLLRAIVDLDENNGTVSLDGTAREAIPATLWRKRVAYVPAESGWWADEVRDHFGDTPDLPKLLDAVGLPGALSWQVGRLSTGERQRLALVRALQNLPDVLLLDEPTSALDPASAERVEQLLKDLIAKGTAVLLVTHDPEQPRRLGALCRHMKNGCLEAEQTTGAPA